MSLHTLANHLQTAGRGDDSLLVHMTPGEVNGLQSLAMAHGGSLSINPETGLPEAGFLSSILPMVAGAALAATGVGAPMAALMVGGAGTVATGSLKKGLMMGLGAYGGAGIGGSLLGGAAGAGAGAAGAASSMASNAAFAPGAAFNQAGTASLLSPGVANAGFAQGFAPGQAFNQAGTIQGIGAGAGATNNAAFAPGQAFNQAANIQQSPVVASNSMPPPGTNVSASSVFDKIKSMPGKAYDLISGSGPEADKAREDFLKENKKNLLYGGLSALTLSRDDPKGPPREAPTQEFNPYYRPSTGQYSAGPMPGKSGERAYSFFADGGSVGQPVEQMSQQNSVGANTNYPMANIKPFGYAVPKNVPVSQNVFQPESYERLDPYTGEQQLAGGGLATLHFKSGGAFISKLKPVTAPKKATPKLADTKKLETEISGLQKYGSYDDQMGTYNDRTNQIKDIQSEKQNKAKELAERQKSYKTDLARMKAESAGRVKEVNAEYTKKVNDFNKETNAEIANRNKSITGEFNSRQKQVNGIRNKAEKASAQRELNEWRTNSTNDLNNYKKDRSGELNNINQEKKSTLDDVNKDINNFNNDFNNFKNEVGAFNKESDSKIAQATKEQASAKQAAGFAKQRQDKEAQFEKTRAANESLVNKANEDYETGMSKFNEYQNALKDEQSKYEEQTKRQATGISGLRAQSTASRISGNPNQAEIDKLQKQLQDSGNYGLGAVGERSEIQRKIDDLKAEYSTGAAGTSSQSGIYTPKYMKDSSGNLVPYQEKATFNKYTKAPGYDGATRIMDESDVNNLFQDVAGRRPTPEEMDKYLGMKTSDAALAGQIMKLPDVAGKTEFSTDDLAENFKYYLGRDPNAGELANMKKSNLTNFNALRNYLQAQPAYVDNLNKIGSSLFGQAMQTQETAAAQEARAGRPLTADEVATSYKDALGRDPTMDELRKYMGTSALPSDITKQLRSSEEYLSSLTKPLVPGLQQGAISTAPLPAPKYAPGTVLEYTPEQQAQTGLGSITGGLQPTATGMQQPMNRGAVTIEGAMPLNPTGQEQLGLQTLFGQLANQAPALQTGMKFAAPEQSMFGFQPYSAAQNPQSLEAILAALKAQQMQQAPVGMADGGMADGGYNLGGYSDGGRLLRGPGDGVSDSIPATIGNRQPARLADGEFVVPARIVSELGNGSTDAGAKKLYAMMQRVQQARGRTVGRGKVAVNSRAEKLLPA
jgi:hypothetical protein